MIFNSTVTINGINYITKNQDYEIFIDYDHFYYSGNNRYYIIDNTGSKVGLTESEIDEVILGHVNDLRKNA